MPNLTSPIPVFVPGTAGHDSVTLYDGDEIPEWAEDSIEPALKGEGDGPPAEEKSPASSGDTFEQFTEEELRGKDNSELEELLDQRQVDHPARARKDDLVRLVLEFQANQVTGGTSPDAQ